MAHSKLRETVPKKNHSLDDRLRPFVPFLPNLLSTAGADHQDALVPAGWWSTLYDVQANQRSAGASHARVMTGKRGTLSLWHIDHDDRAGRTRDRWMATFILMLQGEYTKPSGWLGMLVGAKLWHNFFEEGELVGQVEGLTQSLCM